MLKLNERRIIAEAILMWKIIKFKRPKYLFNTYVSMNVIHARENRHTYKLMQIPCHRTELYAKSFLVTSIKLWNTFDLHQFQTYSTCISLKKYICDKLSYVL